MMSLSRLCFAESDGNMVRLASMPLSPSQKLTLMIPSREGGATIARGSSHWYKVASNLPYLGIITTPQAAPKTESPPQIERRIG
jgi:hypothetical protein